LGVAFERAFRLAFAVVSSLPDRSDDISARFAKSKGVVERDLAKCEKTTR
jgi:hypothetical protein